MTPSGRILLVDDLPRFNEVYREQLISQGYDTESAFSAEEALKKLDEPNFDLVLLDRKLSGQSGPDTGLDLIQEIRNKAPGTKIILITAYADAESVKRAFESGVYDYIEKNTYFAEVLRVKVANAMEAARERRIAALANGKREEVIRKLWEDSRQEKDTHKKGRLLEDLLLVLFKSIPGFERAEKDARSDDEQIDIIVPNESADPFWKNEQSQYFLVECKNWSEKVGPNEFDRLRRNLERRHGRSRLGFLVGANGFTTGLESALAATRETAWVIVLVGPDDLRLLVEADSSSQRNDLLKKFHQRSIVHG